MQKNIASKTSPFKYLHGLKGCLAEFASEALLFIKPEQSASMP
jgi:hypothetical protein